MMAQEHQEEDLKDIKAKEAKSDLSSKAMPITRKDWQAFLVWRVLVMRGSLVIAYSGNNGGMIFCNRKILENILNNVKMENQYNSNGKETYQFQDTSHSYVSRCISNQLGTSGPIKVSFKYVRVSFSRKKCLLYQNTFEVLDTSSLQLGQFLQSVMIEMSLDDFLSPLVHIGAQSVSNKTDSNIGDIDID